MAVVLKDFHLLRHYSCYGRRFSNVSSLSCRLVKRARKSAVPLYVCQQRYATSVKRVDLTHSIDERAIVWPGANKFCVVKRKEGVQDDGTWSSTRDVFMAEHSGTHIDAPYHFFKKGMKLDCMPLKNFFVRCVFIDLKDEVKGNPLYCMTYHPLAMWEWKNGPFPSPCVVIINFGWTQFYFTPERYIGKLPRKNFKFPYISCEAAQWLVKKNKVIGIGTDTATPDRPADEKYVIHRMMLGQNIYIIENLKICECLPPVFDLVVLPLKITGGTGAPCRVIANIPVHN